VLASLVNRRPWLLVAAHAACFWPVWSWYVARFDDGSDEPWALVALLAAAVLGWPRRGWRLNPSDPLLGAAALLTALYALATPLAPPLVRAVLAMAALACGWISVAGMRAKASPLVCLVVLSVPLIASLQFYAGYPLRIATAMGAASLLNLFGADVVREGVGLVAGGVNVQVDAPCSGVRMLWTASVLCCALAAMRARVTWRALAVALLAVVPIVLAANILRAALLYIVEIRPQPLPAGWHSAIGMLSFALVAGLLFASEAVQEHWAQRRRPPALSFRVS